MIGTKPLTLLQTPAAQMIHMLADSARILQAALDQPSNPNGAPMVLIVLYKMF